MFGRLDTRIEVETAYGDAVFDGNFDVRLSGLFGRICVIDGHTFAGLQRLGNGPLALLLGLQSVPVDDDVTLGIKIAFCEGGFSGRWKANQQDNFSFLERNRKNTLILFNHLMKISSIERQ